MHRLIAVSEPGAEQLALTATLTTDQLLNELPQIIPATPISQATPISPGEIETRVSVNATFELR